MPAAREDYLIRLVQQIAAVLCRLRERLTGAAAAGQAARPEEMAAIEREAEDAIRMLLGPQAALLERIDPASAVALVGDADRVALWVALLRLRADVAQARGDVPRAADRGARATALERVAGSRRPG